MKISTVFREIMNCNSYSEKCSLKEYLIGTSYIIDSKSSERIMRFLLNTTKSRYFWSLIKITSSRSISTQSIQSNRLLARVNYSSLCSTGLNGLNGFKHLTIKNRLVHSSTMPNSPSTTLRFQSLKNLESKDASKYLIIGTKSTIASVYEDLKTSALGKHVNESLLDSLPTLPYAFTNGKTDSVSFYSGNSEESSKQITFVHLSAERSRNLGYVRSDLIHSIVLKNTCKESNTAILLVLENVNQIIPAASAVARAFPGLLKPSQSFKRTVYVDFIIKDSSKESYHVDQYGVNDSIFTSFTSSPERLYSEVQAIADSIRLAGRLVDTPCNILHTNTYLEEVSSLVDENKDTLSLEVIKGRDLETRGFGGLWNVGKAAENLPALAIIKYTPKKKSIEKTVSLVGKGIVYDTGGLSIKSTANMSGMKGDMGGSAAVFGALIAASKIGYEGVVYGLLCLAENACGSKAQRVDDTYIGYSGKVVEVNNTDAEGRLVLGDGVAYASKDLKTDFIVDIATLTGAQMITTGMLHAAVLTPDETLETRIRTSGNISGDWVYPILYAPEILLKEFESPIADMKNSVKSRLNAQSSCAGHFIEEHLSKEWKGSWAHIDIAGPAEKDARGTGFGVGLFVAFFKSLSK